MTWHRLHRIGALGVAFILAAVVIGLTAPDGSSDDSNPRKVRDAVVNALTVTSVSVDCVELVNAHGGSTVADEGNTLIRFNNRIGALEGTPPRLWSDALDTPFSATDPNEILLEAQAEICENPLYGVTVCNWFANMSVGDVHVEDLNDWLTPCKGDPLEINNKAAGYIPLLDVDNPTDDQKQTAVTQNIAWQNVAEHLGTLLSRFQVVGVQGLPSTLNYHLVAGGVSAGGLPEVGLNTVQEDLPSLVLALTMKDACIPLKLIGLNIGDKRPEEFALPVCETPATTVPEEESTPTTRPGQTTTTNPPGTTTTVPGTTTSTTVCTSGKCVPPTTVAPPPTTTPVPTTAPPDNGGQGDSGDGATNDTSPPTTEAPAPSPPTTSSPTTNPPPPPG